jgi:hypothetical protein
MMDEMAGPKGDRFEEEGSGVTETVQHAASAAADSVQEVASSIAGTAQDAVSGVVDKVQDVTGAVADKASKVTDAAADQVESLANTVEQAAPPDAPTLQRNIAETTVNVLDRTAEYLRNGDVGLIIDDMRAVIRRNPGRSLLIGLGLGYLARSTFFSGGTSSYQGSSSQRSQPFVPRSQAVPVYGGIDAAYSSPSAMSGSTLSSDMALGADLGLPQASLSGSSGIAAGTTSFAGASDSGLGYAATIDTEGVSGDFADVSMSGSSIGSSSDFAGSGSVMQDNLAGEDMLDTDDVFVTNTDVSALDVADGMRVLGGEEYRSDSSSTDTSLSDDLLNQWDATTRERSGEA